MTNAKTIRATAETIRAAVRAAGLPVHVSAANGCLYFDPTTNRGSQAGNLRAAIEVARPILLACGRKATRIKRNGYRFFRVGESQMMLRAGFRLEMTTAENESVILGRHNMSTTL